MIKRTELAIRFNGRGKATYSMEIWHMGLKEHRVLEGEDPAIVTRQAELEIARWEDQWWVERAERARRKLAESLARVRGERRVEARERTDEALALQETLRNTLHFTLDVDDTVDWESLKGGASFSEPRPVAGETPREPEFGRGPEPPRQTDEKYQYARSLLDLLWPPIRRRKLNEARRHFDADQASWVQQHEDWKAAVEEGRKKHLDVLEILDSAHRQALEEWEADKAAYEERQGVNREAVTRAEARYRDAGPEAIVDYCELVLNNSQYPSLFPKKFVLRYSPSDKEIVVDYQLPAFGDVPTLMEIRYVQRRDDFTESHKTKAEAQAFYTDVLHQVALRTIHELFEADVIGALDVVVFNGWVQDVNEATGNEEEGCILSARTDRERFLNINLGRIDSTACYKGLGGRGASKLHQKRPVAPFATGGWRLTPAKTTSAGVTSPE